MNQFYANYAFFWFEVWHSTWILDGNEKIGWNYATDSNVTDEDAMFTYLYLEKGWVNLRQAARELWAFAVVVVPDGQKVHHQGSAAYVPTGQGTHRRPVELYCQTMPATQAERNISLCCNYLVSKVLLAVPKKKSCSSGRVTEPLQKVFFKEG